MNLGDDFEGTAGQDAPAEGPSLDEAFESAFETVAADEGDGSEGQPAGQPRDQHGRFASQITDANPQAAQTAPQDGAQQASPATEQPQAGSAPAGWSQEDAAIYAGLPPEAQAVINRREQERNAYLNRVTQQSSYALAVVEDLKPTFAKHADMVREIGTAPQEIIGDLFELLAFSRRDPSGYVNWLLETLPGVDREKINWQGQAASEYADPAVMEIRQELQGFKGAVQTIQERYAAEERARYDSTLREFIQSKHEDGTPKYPHFNEARQYMSGLISSGLAGSLDEAYRMATFKMGLAPSTTPAPRPAVTTPPPKAIPERRELRGGRGMNGAAPAAANSLDDAFNSAWESLPN